jgi:hypothetical protein
MSTSATATSFDPALPTAPVLLDPEAMGPVLARSFRGTRDVPPSDRDAALDVAIRFLRYKPGTNLVVHYDVAADGERHDAIGMIASGTYLARRAAKPENVALAHLIAPRVPATAPLSYEDDVGCLVQWYPLDLSLPALAIPPDELRQLIAGAGLRARPSDREPERLAYKPRRRAVLRVDGYVLKLYAREGEFERALEGQRAASTLVSVLAPCLEAAIPERLMTVQSALPGQTLSAAADVAADAGALLARLHASEIAGLPIFEPVAQLDAAAASAALVGAIAPALRPRLGRLLEALQDSCPEDARSVASHGDFNARQLLVTDTGLAVTDFDPFCLAPAALDLATFGAYLVRGGADDLTQAYAVLADVVAGYGGRPLHLDWYLATMILRRAARPFRYFEPDWRTRVEEMVSSSKAALGA